MDIDGSKECKFLIPARLHVLLHRHRVLTGRSISSTVEQALDDFLEGQMPPQGVHL